MGNYQTSWLDLHGLVTATSVRSFWPHQGGKANHEQFLYKFLGKSHVREDACVFVGLVWLSFFNTGISSVVSLLG